MSVAWLIEQFAGALLEGALTYVIFSVPLFVVFWVIWKKTFQRIRIQETQQASGHHFRHDLLHSVPTIGIFALMDMTLLYLDARGYTHLYQDVGQYGWGWLILSFVIALLLNDTFFYWSHRAMHHPRLYGFFHRVHHESTDPSPLTSFAFHPSEAILEGLVAFLLPFIMPVHIGVVIAVQVFDMLNNVLAHLGYELYPQGWTRWPLLKYKTASTHHNMHHQLFDGNYGLYFTWWDKWMGTEFKDYESRHRQIFERKQVSQVAENQAIVIAAEGPAQVHAQVHGADYHFSVGEGETILQAALNQQIPLPHACRRGRCGTCKLYCASGQVEMPEAPALSETERQAGYILTCQAQPRSSEVRLERRDPA
ncbi:MAG: sterol desaturase family protein [Bacteroidia bacterium]|nr:sterol desaturase family protein [Bacteroidia bacterium]